MQKFRFTTRLQRLNSLGAEARASLNFQEQLQRFHSQQGRKRFSVPVIASKSLDLYSLKLIVSSFGGFDQTTKSRKWTEVARQLGYSSASSNALSTQVKAAYKRLILPWEEFIVEAREQAKRDHDDARAAAADDDVPMEDGSRAGTPDVIVVDDDDTVAGKRRSARKRGEGSGKDSQFVAQRVPKRQGHQQKTTKDARIKTLPGAEELVCAICMSGDDGTSMLLCDECNRGYHMFCLTPPLATVPKSEWYCPPCLVGTGENYGFEEGQTHSLHSFWERSEKFRKAWWTAHRHRVSGSTAAITAPDGDVEMRSTLEESGSLARPIAGTDIMLSEDDVEREFWRLVASSEEIVDVEYGADVHSVEQGSASPSLEKHPTEKYARDAWNVNNFPIQPGSLLRYIKSDVSGMTQPWIYVGMMFSAFCWHNEDHYTYSMNYQHFGHTKTWYGVPGDDAEKFEESMKRAAPGLFETSPDLLFQLVTLMSPEKLKKDGVRVYACDQRPNEIVITYPKAYHAGFNQGYNLNEAVNFALPDWMEYGLESVQRYQSFRKGPVFSHDELIVTIAQHNQALSTAMWLQYPMVDMIEREMKRRRDLRALAPNIREEVYDYDKEEHEFQCARCNVFCYLAQVTSEASKGVSCLEHPAVVFRATSSPNGRCTCGSATSSWSS